MGYEKIIYLKAKGLAKITLNRPQKLNSMDGDMIEEIGSALEDSERDSSVRVVVLTGKGRAFCSGLDLKFVGEKVKTLSDQQELFKYTNKVVTDAIENIGKPVIAAVNGFALGGGFEVMLACDLAIASEDAIIGDQHINFGLVGPGGSTKRTPRIVGIRKAKELIFTGDKISAKEAERIGLINRVVPAKELEKATHEIASRIAEKSPVALRIAKTLLNQSLEVDSRRLSELEVMAAIVNATSEDYEEGMRAFREAREPVFRGR
jgi:enoyl-CoA hydratase/carnithine racemase